MSRTRRIAAALALAAATLPALARAEGEGHGDPGREARIEALIQQAIQGGPAAEQREQARIDRLVRAALERAGLPPASGGDPRADLLAQTRR